MGCLSCTATLTPIVVLIIQLITDTISLPVYEKLSKLAYSTTPMMMYDCSNYVLCLIYSLNVTMHIECIQLLHEFENTHGTSGMPVCYSQTGMFDILIVVLWELWWEETTHISLIWSTCSYYDMHHIRE